MRLGGQRLDLALYFQALPLYARNLGVLLPPLIAAIIGIGLDYASGPLFAGVGGAGASIVAFIVRIIEGFAFGVSVIFADDAWRHGRGHLRTAWDQSRRKAGEIIIATIGFFFLIYIAQMIGGIVNATLSEALGALALWAFIYAIAAAAIGGLPGGAAFSASLQAARRHPLATAILAIVCIIVWYGLAEYAVAAVGPYVGVAGFEATRALLTAIALGYIALIIARQYADFAFRFW
jgi:hypothetical protein